MIEELDTVGGALVLDHIRALIETGAYLILLAAMGRKLTQGWALKGVRSGERLGYQVTLGAGVMALAMLVLALAQQLGVVAIFGVLAAAVLWSRREIAPATNTVLGAARGVVTSLPPGWPRAVGGVLAAAFAGAVVSRALMPPADWDTQMYHLPLPLHFLAEGGFAVPEGNTMLSSAGLPHLLALPLLVFGGMVGMQLLNAALLFVLIAFVGAVAWRFGRRPFEPGTRDHERRHGLGAAIAILAIVGTTVVTLVGETARGETTLALFLIVGHVALIRAAESEWNPGWVLRTGLALGAAAWVEISSGLYGVGLIPVAIWAAFRDGQVGAAFNRLLTLGMLAVAMAGPWWMVKWRVFGSPLYPRGAPRQVPPWMAELFGTRTPEGVGADPIFGFGGALAEAEAALYVLSPLLLLAPAAFLGRKRRVALALAAPVAIAVFLQFGVLDIPSPRYLIAVVPALALLAGLGAEALAGTLEGRRRLAFGVFLAATAVASVAPVTGRVFRVQESVPHALGRTSPRETLVARGMGGLLALAERLDAEAPAPGRILLVGESRELYLPPGVLADIQRRNWPLVVRAGADATCMAGAGVTHVVVNDLNLEHYLRDYEGRDDPRAILRLDELEAFLSRCAVRLEGAPGGYRLYRVATTTPDPTSPG